MGLLRTLLVIIFVYYIFRFLNRFILPFLLKGYINKNREYFQGTNQNKSNRKEGDVTINYNHEKKKKNFDDKGEYVEFEEID